MLRNDVYISIRVFIFTDMKNSLHRIQFVKSGKKTIVPQVIVFGDNFPFIADSRVCLQPQCIAFICFVCLV